MRPILALIVLVLVATSAGAQEEEFKGDLFVREVFWTPIQEEIQELVAISQNDELDTFEKNMRSVWTLWRIRQLACPGPIEPEHHRDLRTALATVQSGTDELIILYEDAAMEGVFPKDPKEVIADNAIMNLGLHLLRKVTFEAAPANPPAIDR
jgi:hypothetical protein